MPDAPFPKTSWSLISRAGTLTPQGRKALAIFCKAYWIPVYAFIRRHGSTPEDAYDQSQEFFYRMLARNDLAKVDRTYGSKFRSWLCQCVKNFLKNARKKERAGKRIPPEQMDSPSADAAEECYQAEPSHNLTPERLYEHHFALKVLELVLEGLRSKYAAAGKEPLFDALKGCLTDDPRQKAYEDVAASLKMSTGAVKKAAFDLRSHYKSMLRAEVASLLDIEGEDGDKAVDEELKHFLWALDDG